LLGWTGNAQGDAKQSPPDALAREKFDLLPPGDSVSLEGSALLEKAPAEVDRG
jgi:hypothetical protein